MKLEERIKSFAALGEILRNVLNGKGGKQEKQLNSLIDNQHKHNPWFTPENVRLAIKAISDELTYENLSEWTKAYPRLNEINDPISVGVIMAGNIPLAGFHDFLSVLISGNKLIAKTSSKDSEMMVFISDILSSVNPEFKDKISFIEGIISGFDAVIATGSDNSSRYFEYYFGKYPNIIRKNRNSVAVIDGNETDIELENLGKDIFLYFGLGCRSVSKIFVPAGYDFERMIRNWKRFSGIINHGKYANNYDFNMAVYLVNKEKFLDTGYLILKENKGLSSPVSVLYYEYYKNNISVFERINNLKEKIQCVVGRNNVPFGQAQSPRLWEYTDNINTLDFLLKKNMSGIS
jgi:hypothetical protein